MGGHDRDILRHMLKDRGHQLRVFLVGGIVGKRPETLVIDRLPDELIKYGIFTETRTHGIQLVLRRDHLCTDRGGIAVQVHPIRRIAKVLRRAGDGHGYPVMPEAHPDISDDKPLFHIHPGRSRFLGQRHVFHAEQRSDHRVFLDMRIEILRLVIPEFLPVFFLRSPCLFYFRLTHPVPEDNA